MKPIFGIGALAFLGLLLLGGGVFLHGTKQPVTAAATSISKPAAKAVHGKAKSAAKAAPKDPAPGIGTENPLVFPLMVGGGLGLLLSSVLALALNHSQRPPTPEAARKMREAERTAQRRHQEEFEAQQEALQSQLAEAKRRKAETEILRDQVSRQFQEFFRTLPVPCFCFAANGKIIRWNAACETLYGIPAAAALEATLWETLVPASEREDAEAKISRVLAGESLLGTERRDTVAGGGQSLLRCSMVPLCDAEGLIIGGLSAGVEVTEFSQLQQQIAALTREPNAALTREPAAAPAREPAAAPAPAKAAERIAASITVESSVEMSGHPAFRARLAEEVDRAARYHAPLSLILLDLDSFAARNRSFGFEAGDQALEAMTAVIKTKIRTIDVLARLGADEYAVILPETGDAGARVAADRLRAGIAGITISGQPPLSACLGVALLTPEIADTAMFVTRAQDALAEAQSLGIGSVAHFQDHATVSAISIPAPARPRRTAARTAKV